MKIAATVGTFDGVHRGHQMLLESLRTAASAGGLTPVAYTFDRHPLEIVAPARAPKMLCSPGERCARIAAMDVVPQVLPFTEELRHLTAREWMSWLRDERGAELIVIGYDNTFGSDGRGLSPIDYMALADELGIALIEAPVVPGISSSAIRKAVAAGDVESASEMLGRQYAITGKVVAGKQIGRSIGVPTANLEVKEDIAIPAGGVYAAKVSIGKGEECAAVVNIGTRPTVDACGIASIEAHLIGFQGDLYDRTLALSFIRRLRDERRFESLTALKNQIAIDIESATEFE